MQIRSLFFLLLFSTSLFSLSHAQDNPTGDLDNPRATIATHLGNLQTDEFHPEIAAKTIYGPELSLEQKIKKAKQLKQILDAQGLYVDENLLPTNPDYIDSANGKHVYFLFKLYPQVYLEKIKGQWYYSRTTVKSIDQLYDETFLLGSEALLNLLPHHIAEKKFLSLKVWKWVGLSLFLIISIFLFFILNPLFNLVFRTLDKSRFNDLIPLEASTKSISRAVSLFIIFLLLKVFLPSLMLPIGISKWVFTIIAISMIVFAMLFAMALVRIFGSYMLHLASKTENSLDDQLIPLLVKLANATVVILALFLILNQVGVNLAALIAGVSIGGVALALAAQDTVKNFFGSIVIFLDRPFQIGDWIEVDGANGIVEEVGIRSTRIRTFANTLVTYPNGKLADTVVNNWGLRVYRRYTTKVGVLYDTPPELIEKFVEGMKDVIKNHPNTRKDYYEIHLNEFNAYSLDILVYVFFEAPSWTVELKGRHEVMIGFIKLAKVLGVEFAYPTQTLQIENLPEQTGRTYETDSDNLDERLEAFLKEYKADMHGRKGDNDKINPLGG